MTTLIDACLALPLAGSMSHKVGRSDVDQCVNALAGDFRLPEPDCLQDIGVGG